jgi:hypothetical protein
MGARYQKGIYSKQTSSISCPSSRDLFEIEQIQKKKRQRIHKQHRSHALQISPSVP